MENKNSKDIEYNAEHKEYQIRDLFSRAMSDESWESDPQKREEVGGLWWFTLGNML